jgi:hypothetical protein
MEPMTWIMLGSALLGTAGKIFGGGGAPPAPNYSSATAGGGALGGPMNVGGGIGGAGTIGAIGQFAPWIAIGLVAWALLSKK